MFVVQDRDVKTVYFSEPVTSLPKPVFTGHRKASGCRVAQLVKCLVTSGYPDGSRLEKWKDSHPAVAEHDCPEINSSQRWRLCKKNAHVVWSHGDLGSSRSSISS